MIGSAQLRAPNPGSVTSWICFTWKCEEFLDKLNELRVGGFTSACFKGGGGVLVGGVALGGHLRCAGVHYQKEGELQERLHGSEKVLNHRSSQQRCVYHVPGPNAHREHWQPQLILTNEDGNGENHEVRAVVNTGRYKEKQLKRSTGSYSLPP